MPRTLVVKVTAGADDAERCNQGFTVAATAVAATVNPWLQRSGSSVPAVTFTTRLRGMPER